MLFLVQLYREYNNNKGHTYIGPVSFKIQVSSATNKIIMHNHIWVQT